MTQKGLDRAAVLKAAAALAEEIGLEFLTLNRLAARLGIKTPSLYNHLGGMADLQCGLAQLGLDRLGDALRDAAIGKSKSEALTALAIEFRRFAKQNPELYRAVMKLPGLKNDELKKSADVIVQICFKIMEPYHYKKEDAMHIIRTWKSAVHGFISLESAGFFRGKSDVEESFNRMISCILSGMNKEEL